MHRFFVAELEGDPVQITGEDVRHITKVLRLSPGEEITLCDGRGSECRARIQKIHPESVECGILERGPALSEPSVKVTLFQCIPKAGKMETIIQKCTELGIHAIVPVSSDRCVARPAERFENRRIRYQRVAEEAAKQSRRGIIPQVSGLTGIREIEPGEFDLFILCDEEERQTTLKSVLRSAGKPQRIAVLIGPEGGLTREESLALRAKGAAGVTLGTRILRTETAGMAVLAQVLYEVEG